MGVSVMGAFKKREAKRGDAVSSEPSAAFERGHRSQQESCREKAAWPKTSQPPTAALPGGGQGSGHSPLPFRWPEVKAASSLLA